MAAVALAPLKRRIQESPRTARAKKMKINNLVNDQDQNESNRSLAAPVVGKLTLPSIAAISTATSTAAHYTIPVLPSISSDEGDCNEGEEDDESEPESEEEEEHDDKCESESDEDVYGRASNMNDVLAAMKRVEARHANYSRSDSASPTSKAPGFVYVVFREEEGGEGLSSGRQVCDVYSSLPTANERVLKIYYGEFEGERQSQGAQLIRCDIHDIEDQECAWDLDANGGLAFGMRGWEGEQLRVWVQKRALL
jgi:hypothetical protein